VNTGEVVVDSGDVLVSYESSGLAVVTVISAIVISSRTMLYFSCLGDMAVYISALKSTDTCKCSLTYIGPYLYSNILWYCTIHENAHRKLI